MSLIELPDNTGKVFLVNPHHVTDVAPVSATLRGHVGLREMSCLRVAGHPTTRIYVCAWAPETVADLLNTARREEMDHFAAGWQAARDAPEEGYSLISAWRDFIGKVEATT